MMQTRRNFLKLGLAGAGSLMISPWEFAYAARGAVTAATAADPHFFLMIVLNGAADSSYMFDARPLSMTKAGKIQNYWSKNNEEPSVWQGANGQTCLASSLIKPLIPYKNRFSILNGVMMTPTFDGHLQNMNFLFSGGPFGGESFIPHLNAADTGVTPDSLDGLNVGEELPATVSNHSSVVPLDPDGVSEFSAKLKKIKPPSGGTELMDFIRGRMSTLSSGTGRFSKGAALMSGGINGAPGLHEQLTRIKAPKTVMNLVSDCFKNGIARSAIYTFPEAFDVHAADAAKAQPELFKTAIDKIADVFKSLTDTPFDSKKSMFDVTTVLVATEMGRTLRVHGQPIHETGTNHNQFSNSMLLAGKGIKGNYVVGASDMPDEKAPVSKAHSTADAILEKTFGCPFDFATMKVRPDLPETFKIEDYLTVGSVVNTIYSSFGVPQSKMRTLGRDLPIAPILKDLLS